MKKVITGSDHGGFALKQEIKKYLEESGYEYEDVGCNSEESCDYPIYGKKAAEKVRKTGGIGILICGTGIGMCITANKVNGIRAALCHDEYTAKMAREHNNANVLCIGGRVLSSDMAKKITKIFLETEFSGEERHKNRINEITNLESSK